MVSCLQLLLFLNYRGSNEGNLNFGIMSSVVVVLNYRGSNEGYLNFGIMSSVVVVFEL